MAAQVFIYNHKNAQNVSIAMFNEEACKVIGSENIVIDSHKLRVKAAGLEDNRIYKLCAVPKYRKYKDKKYEYPTSQWTCCFRRPVELDVCGRYELEARRAIRFNLFPKRKRIYASIPNAMQIVALSFCLCRCAIHQSFFSCVDRLQTCRIIHSCVWIF